MAPVQASQAIAVQHTAQQSRSPLEALQQNQSQDEIRCFNQQSNVGAQQTNAAQNVSSGTFQYCTFNFYGQSESFSTKVFPKRFHRNGKLGFLVMGRVPNYLPCRTQVASFQFSSYYYIVSFPWLYRDLCCHFPLLH